ncbi:WhiB family transcriptional regulator [Nocardia sp. NPDC050435]|uniref:WhiB family transcriptional regulator n=1 Tax=Nocardia sp. NPDC050435 TaxID=3155040 RepID=UPI0033C6CB88
MVAAKCRGAPVHELKKWEADNRGRGQTGQVVQACRGCPVMVECAAYGLEQGPAGMVWAGVPVPEWPYTAYYQRAIDRLEQIADGGWAVDDC